VVISRDKILTAAHCLFNERTRRVIPAEARHFLVGYRTGRYSVHVRLRDRPQLRSAALYSKL